MTYIRYLTDNKELIEEVGQLYYAVTEPETRRIVLIDKSVAMDVYPGHKLYNKAEQKILFDEPDEELDNRGPRWMPSERDPLIWKDATPWIPAGLFGEYKPVGGKPAEKKPVDGNPTEEEELP